MWGSLSGFEGVLQNGDIYLLQMACLMLHCMHVYEMVLPVTADVYTHMMVQGVNMLTQVLVSGLRNHSMQVYMIHEERTDRLSVITV